MDIEVGGVLAYQSGGGVTGGASIMVKHNIAIVTVMFWKVYVLDRCVQSACNYTIVK